MLWFNPKITHNADPLATVQVIDLPAELAAAPIAAVTPLISVAEYCRVHCSAAGCVPPAAIVRLTVTLLPGVPAPEPNVKLAVWAFAIAATANTPKITLRNLTF